MSPYNPREIREARMNMWLDRILKNLIKLELEFDQGNYVEVRKQLVEQYRLIVLLKESSKGNMLLLGKNQRLNQE